MDWVPSQFSVAGAGHAGIPPALFTAALIPGGDNPSRPLNVPRRVPLAGYSFGWTINAGTVPLFRTRSATLP